ncbi:hypothetical protein BH20ACI2_BH20ACI2_23070 [soil metagenome]
MSYVSEVAQLFLLQNPDIPFLSPLDYVLISEWEKEEIPLPLVLDAIREFSITPENATQPSLTYLRNEVKNSYALWLTGKIP